MSDVDVHVTPEPEPSTDDAPTQTVVVENTPAPAPEPVENDDVPVRDEALAEHRLHHESLERHIDEKFDEVMGVLREHAVKVGEKLDSHDGAIERLEGSSHVHEDPSEDVQNAESTLVTPQDLSTPVVPEVTEKKISKARKWGF